MGQTYKRGTNPLYPIWKNIFLRFALAVLCACDVCMSVKNCRRFIYTRHWRLFTNAVYVSGLLCARSLFSVVFPRPPIRAATIYPEHEHIMVTHYKKLLFCFRNNFRSKIHGLPFGARNSICVCAFRLSRVPHNVCVCVYVCSFDCCLLGVAWKHRNCGVLCVVKRGWMWW